jgi:hypothetical protein
MEVNMLERDSLWDRLGALTGIIFVALMAASLFLGSGSNHPSPGDGSAIITEYLTEHRDESELANSIMLVALFFFILFVSYLGQHLRHSEGDRGWLASAAYGGGLVTAGLLLVGTAGSVAGNVMVDSGGDTQAITALYAFGWDFVLVLCPPLGVLVGATSIAGIRYAALPAWLSWLGVPIAVVLGLTPLGFFGFLFFFPWLALVSIVLPIRAWRSSPHPTPHAAGLHSTT